MRAYLKSAGLLLGFIWIFTGCLFAQAPEKLGEKAQRLQGRIKERARSGKDVAEALRLDRESQAAARNEDWAQVERLLDQALSLFEDGHKSMSLASSLKGAILTEGIADSATGKEVAEYSSAFKLKRIKGSGEKMEIPLSSTPVFVEEVPSARLPAGSDSPFGFHPAHIYKNKVDRKRFPPPSQMGYDYSAALDMGISWTRPEYYALWGMVQKTPREVEEGIFDWQENDYVFCGVPSGMRIMANIDGIESRTILPAGKSRRMFTFTSDALEKKYVVFVQKLVERYDGDGTDDAFGLKSPVRYWQVSNEPDLASEDVSGYAHLMEITYTAIKSSCQDCQVIMGGMAGGVSAMENFYGPVLDRLKGKYVDVFEFHLYGGVGSWKMYKDAVQRIRAFLKDKGYGTIPLWIGETGTYTGIPRTVDSRKTSLPEQSERAQAEDIIKRYVYAAALGIERVFWAFGVTEGFDYQDSDFDHMGLIYSGLWENDPGFGIKKLGYYSFKMMTGKLEGSDFSRVETLSDGKDGIYAFKFLKAGKPVYVLWREE